MATKKYKYLRPLLLPAQIKYLNKVAKRNKQSVSELVRELIDDYMSRFPF